MNVTDESPELSHLRFIWLHYSREFSNPSFSEAASTSYTLQPALGDFPHPPVSNAELMFILRGTTKGEYLSL